MNGKTNNKDNAQPARSALRTVLIVLAVVVGVVVYAYGWNTTDISLDEIQDQTRKESVRRALRELLSPDIFDRDRDEASFYAQFQVGCPEAGATIEQPEQGDDAYVVFSPSCADQDEIVTVEGYNFPDNAIAMLRLPREGGNNIPFKVMLGSSEDAKASNENIFDVDNRGYFKVHVKVPRHRDLEDGEIYEVEIPTISPTGLPRFSNTTDTVIEKMIETIFLALMATTLAIPVAVALSFFSARNLMRQMRMPLGPVLVGFVLLPVGGAVGYLLLGPLGELGIDWGEDVVPGIIGAIVAIGAYTLITRLAARLELDGLANRARGVVLNFLLLAVIVFTLGVLGGIGIWISDRLEKGLLQDLGEFVGTVGTLIDLMIAVLAAVGGAFWLSSLGSNLAAAPLRYVQEPLSNVLGGVLGFLSGAILLYVTALIGTQAVLLGLLSAVVAAVLGGQCAGLVYERLFMMENGKRQPRRDDTGTEQAVRSAVFVIGAVLAFLLAAYVLDLLRAIVDERPPSKREWDLILGVNVRIYLAQAALLGGVFGGLAGALSGTSVTFPLGMAVYNTSRTILNSLRAIEPLIMGIVFVIWVGVGPFAGVLALTLHSIAALGKLYSEQVENIDAGPIEAVQATGANRLQMIVYGVVPQIVPPYIAFTMYRWDINVRMSTIIGFVGGGGIGFLLQQQINLLRYDQAGVAVLAIAIVVSVLDYASAAIRERIV
jgi:phosphonate ABC transporter permease subunit PhnE